MLDNAIPQGFEDAVELRRKNRETVVKYMNTKGQDRLRRHERSRALGGKSGMTRAEPLVLLCGFQEEASPLAVGDDVAIGTVTRMGRDEHPWLAWFASE